MVLRTRLAGVAVYGLWMAQVALGDACGVVQEATPPPPPTSPVSWHPVSPTLEEHGVHIQSLETGPASTVTVHALEAGVLLWVHEGIY